MLANSLLVFSLIVASNSAIISKQTAEQEVPRKEGGSAAKRESLDGGVTWDGESSNWVVLTSSNDEKVRKYNFTEIREEKLMQRISVYKFWKETITRSVLMDENDLSEFVSHTQSDGLKAPQTNSVNLLANGLQFVNSPTVNRYGNITCTRNESYICTYMAQIAYRVPCFWSINGCLQYRNEPRQRTCYRLIDECCHGYTLSETGYCEKSSPEGSISANSGCGDRYLKTDFSGVITSPNYPGEYPLNATCKWGITGPVGTYVILHVVDMELENPLGACDLQRWECYEMCSFDYLEIIDTTSKKSRILCGDVAPTTLFHSDGNAMEVKFVSDVSSSKRGFSLVYGIATENDIFGKHTCPNGQIWRVCHWECARTCNNYETRCYKVDGTTDARELNDMNHMSCEPGCACPDSSPIWHNGECVKPEACNNTYFECGKSVVNGVAKIVGGRESERHHWPWMTQITNSLHKHICGGTLICSNWVLTAAHCFLNIRRTELDLALDGYFAKLGKHKKFEKNEWRSQQTFKLVQIILHSAYKIDSNQNDIALVRLSSVVHVTNYVRPACLPEAMKEYPAWALMFQEHVHYPPVGDSCTVTGWGETRNVGPSSSSLKEVDIEVREGRLCSSDLSYKWELMICAGGHANKDSCRGDSGGGLMCKEKKQYTVEGVTSYGDFCGKEDEPGVYTRVAAFVPWIRSFVGEKCGAV